MHSNAAYQHELQGIEVLVTRLDASPEAIPVLAASLSEAERLRARRYRFLRDRRRFIVARALLRRLLAARLGVPARSVELTCGRNGKPALGPRFAGAGWRFNLSRCGDVAAYVLSAGREVGVDIEAVRAVPEADRIAARFFSRRENQAYRALEPRERPLGFFNCWTRKEAFVKALGDGLAMPLDRFDVTLAPGEPARILRVGGTRGEASGWRLDGFFPLPGFVAAVASHCK